MHQLHTASVDRALYTFVFNGKKIDQREQKKAGIELLRPVMLYKTLHVPVEAPLQDVVFYGFPFFDPYVYRCLEPVSPCYNDTPVKRNPAHDLGINKMVRTVSNFPDAVVGLFPVINGHVADVPEKRP